VTVRVVVVRHACAGDKQTWQDDDVERPLDDGGVQQALALAPVLADRPVRRLISSPMRRCRQTLEPLSERLRMEIETSDLLLPDGSIADLLGNDGDTSGDAVVCTHGELMRPLLAHARARQVPIVSQRGDDEWLMMKGSAWHLTFDGDGLLVELRHEAPLPITNCIPHASSD
jgi:phosphohistidine phosphatase SixA